MFLRKLSRVAQKPGSRRRENRLRSRQAMFLLAMALEDRMLLSGNVQNAVGQLITGSPSVVLPASLSKGAPHLAIGTTVDPTITPGGDDVYQIQPTADGRLIAEVEVTSGSPELRLSLFDAQGELLVASDGQSTGQQNPLIDQHIAGGVDYELEVQSLAGAGSYSLSTSLTPASDPNQPVGISSTYYEGGNFGDYVPLAVGDFTNNGRLEIVASDGIHLNAGDGTFEPAAPGTELFDPSQQAAAMTVGDFNGDGNLDVAVALASDDSVSIAMGNGNGTFQPPTTIGLPAGSEPEAIVAGPFTGTGYTDLAVADAGTNSVTILLNNGQGDFQVLPSIPVGSSPDAIAMGDFENDGRLDIAVANILSSSVTILSNQGGGVFRALQTVALPAGSTPTGIVAADFGNGQIDLAATDSSSSQVDVLLGQGDGNFQLTSSIDVGANPFAIMAADFAGNGKTDLAIADANDDDVALLMGNGDGTFQPAIYIPVGTTPLSLVVGDLTGDGHLDLATGNLGADNPGSPSSSSISVLLGEGGGAFAQATANPVGIDPVALATGDFTGNGNLGVAVLNQGSNSVTILPGNGDGTFQQPLTFSLPAGSDASAIVAADFNDDGRADLAVAEPGLEVDGGYGAIQILLGNGDGTFDALPPISVPGANAIVAGDFTGNGRIDLAVADTSSDTVTILMGNGDGTFTITQIIPIGVPSNPSFPEAIVAFDSGNGQTDLAVADEGTDDVTVLMNNGQGNFTELSPILLSPSLGVSFASTISLLAGDFTNDGLPDLAVATVSYFTGSSIEVLVSNGNGTFVPLQPIALGFGTDPVAIVAGDFTDNGITDLATADSNGNGDDYSVYLGNGDGAFQGPAIYSLGGTGTSTALVTGDFLGNGQTDLAIAQTAPDDLFMRLSNGDGTFSDPSILDLARRNTPVVGDLSGNGAPGVSVVDSAGDILYRAAIAGEPGVYEAPVTVNPGDPSRDVAFVQTLYGPALASVDVDDNAISFFVLRPTGFVLVGKLATGLEPAQILAADLDGTGVADLVVRNAGDGTILVYMGNGRGWFLAPISLAVGLGASNIEVADLQNNGRMDILYTNRVSGEVGVLRNLGNGSFASPEIYHAGPGPYGVNESNDPTAVTSLEATDSLTVGTLTPDGLPSIVTLNPGSNTFGVLTGLGGDRFDDSAIFPTDGSGLVVRFVTLSDEGPGETGLAILTPAGLYIQASDGFGDFLPPVKIDVGFEPNGLTVANLDGSGPSDLLISNPLGEVQVLVSNGNGGFAPPRNLDQQVTITPVGPDPLHPEAFIYSDQLTDQLVVKTASGVTTVLGDAATGLRSPGAFALADLSNDGLPCLIVANSGSNNVLVYPGLPNGTFGPGLNGGNGFFTGTNPVSITVADLTGDGRLDLIVANKGSSDVSILLNEPDPNPNGFTFVPGPQLAAGIEPVATAIADVYGNGQSDLVIANSGSNNVMVLPPIGNGFFNDQNPTVYSVGTDPSDLYIGNFTGGVGEDIATINSGSNTVSLLADLGSASPINQSISSGGIDPTAGFAIVPGTGAASLVVANEGDGVLALFEGSAAGFMLVSTVSTPDLANPTALALASFTNGQVEFYAASAGQQAAVTLALSLDSRATVGAVAISGTISLGSVDVNPAGLTVGIGSSNITFAANLSIAPTLARANSSNATSAATAFSFSLSSSSAFENMVTGKESGGVLALFEGSAAGLTLAPSTAAAGPPTAAALVLVGLTGAQAELYSGTEGREAAALLALSLGVQPTLAMPSLVPLQESSLALVGSLLPATVGSPANTVDLGLAETESAISLSSGAPIPVGQSLLGEPAGQNVPGASPEPPAQDEQATPGAGTGSPPAWIRYLVSTDEAIEKFNREHPDLSAPANDQTATIGPSGGLSELQAPAVPSQGQPPGQRTSWRDQKRTEAIDGAIERLHNDGRDTLEHSSTWRVSEAHRPIDDMRIAMVGFTHPTICLDNGRLSESRRRSDEMSIRAIDWTQTAVQPDPGQGNAFDLSAALALAATVARGIYVPARDRQDRMGRLLGSTRMAGWE